MVIPRSRRRRRSLRATRSERRRKRAVSRWCLVDDARPLGERPPGALALGKERARILTARGRRRIGPRPLRSEGPQGMTHVSNLTFNDEWHASAGHDCAGPFRAPNGPRVRWRVPSARTPPLRARGRPASRRNLPSRGGRIDAGERRAGGADGSNHARAKTRCRRTSALSRRNSAVSEMALAVDRRFGARPDESRDWKQTNRRPRSASRGRWSTY
jgi:hypothetical protein